ncbi:MULTISPECIES: adenylate/guanylate cyclase domain-containing protein [unclassified Candidatus Accumulibacter]|uniref:adenylate/guanylate cyclase domain-containing protein n=1 Tax=unclassified Candidatus Accumulibacter TaxID=2619054 RepID=UPI0025C1E3E1|nr:MULTISPECIES: adenylate/guanylate cyclase domain-containing protein [unclassified Candidatus Accumulibacter]HRF12300.1 adenylate/guanylate cyclase domain-containing protein [Candidatus Accumulibacter phosphatis]
MGGNHEVSRAILFADVCGSTRLYHRLGDGPARKLIGSLLKDLVEITRRYDGEKVKTIGDELMSAFADPDAAALAARQMQLRAQERCQDRPLSVRIGFHWGSVIRLKDDYLGDVVNLAARVAGLATVERILTTQTVRDRLSGTLQENMYPRGDKALKGFDTPVDVWEVLWRPATDLAPARFAADNFVFADSHLRLRHGGREYVINKTSEPLTIGRMDTNRLVIDDPCASSHHAAIEYWGGHFVLLDTSLNGVYLRFDGMPDTFRAPGQIHLRKSGTLWFGRYPQDPEAAAATFVCETREA